MVQQVITFQTSDGKKFTSEIEANGHEKLLSIATQVDAYVAAAGVGLAEATRARKYISGFLAFADAAPAADSAAAEA